MPKIKQNTRKTNKKVKLTKEQKLENKKRSEFRKQMNLSRKSRH